jgi:hypothetical protein
MSEEIKHESSSVSENEANDRATPLPSNKSVRKRPRSSADFFELMTCSICMDYFVPPVINCRKGHSFCSTCIDKIEKTTRELSCPQCRAPIDKTCRNYTLEDQLEKISVVCSWRSNGCKKRISLSERVHHERHCEFRPGFVKCYYSDPYTPESCDWTGNPLKLPKHIKHMHGITSILRNREARFLWNPPRPDLNRFRYRLLKINYPSQGKQFTKFILEHFYNSASKLLYFCVRTFDADIKLNYKIKILNRSNERNKLAFSGTTLDYEEVGCLVDRPFDKKSVFIVPLEVLGDYSFFCPEDHTTYFSIHVKFSYKPANELQFDS